MKRFKIGLAAAAAVAAMGVGSGSALAAGTTATCAFEGKTTALTPVQLMGGGGSFAFSATAACQVNGSPVVGTLTASGTYSNTVCGTGSASGTASIPGLGTRSFTITFASGAGVVFVAGQPAGAVQLLPTSPDTSACVSGFTVVGAFSVD